MTAQSALGGRAREWVFEFCLRELFGFLWGCMLGHREMTKIMFYGYGCCSRKSFACALLLLCTAWGPLGKGWVELICFRFFFSPSPVTGMDIFLALTVRFSWPICLMDIQKLQVKMKVKKPDGATLIFKPRVQVWVQLPYLYRPLDMQAELVTHILSLLTS